MFSFSKKFAKRNKKAVEIDTFDKWDIVREHLGDNEMLNAIPKMLGTDKTEELIKWFCQDYDIRDFDEDYDPDEDNYNYFSKKQAPAKKASKVIAKSPYKRVTPKQLKDMVKEGVAIDITEHPDVYNLSREKKLECIGTGLGIYGLNCAMFKDKDGKIYVITKRNTNLLTLV